MAIVPWEEVSEPKTLAEGYGKRFDVRKLKDHHGKIVDFYYFERPDWSVVLPITKEGNVVLIRQYKQGSGRIMEELPGGNADFSNESPEAVARREFKEETGYEAGTVIYLGSSNVDSRSSHSKLHAFLAKDCIKTSEPHVDEEEQIEQLEVPFVTWAKEMLTAETDEWNAVIILLKALPHLGFDIVKALEDHFSKTSISAEKNPPR